MSHKKILEPIFLKTHFRQNLMENKELPEQLVNHRRIQLADNTCIPFLGAMEPS